MKRFISRSLVLFLGLCFVQIGLSQTIMATFLSEATGCSSVMSLFSNNAGSPLVSNDTICIQVDYKSPTELKRQITVRSEVPEGIKLLIQEKNTSNLTHDCQVVGEAQPIFTEQGLDLLLIDGIRNCNDNTTRYFQVTAPTDSTNFSEIGMKNVKFTFKILPSGSP